MTVLDLIKSAMRKIGAIASGELPDADEQADALVCLNQIIDSWNFPGLALYREDNAEYILVPSQQDYTIGSGADFDGPRPIRLCGAFVTRAGYDYQLYNSTQDEWNSIVNKSQAGQLPEEVWYEPTFPNGTIHIWPVPLEALTITLKHESQLDSFATVGDTVALPPGYERALTYALAVDLAPEYPAVTLSDTVIEAANESLAAIKAANNNRQSPATFDDVLCGVGGSSLADFMAGR